MNRVPEPLIHWPVSRTAKPLEKSLQKSWFSCDRHSPKIDKVWTWNRQDERLMKGVHTRFQADRRLTPGSLKRAWNRLLAFLCYTSDSSANTRLLVDRWTRSYMVVYFFSSELRVHRWPGIRLSFGVNRLMLEQHSLWNNRLTNEPNSGSARKHLSSKDNSCKERIWNRDLIFMAALLMIRNLLTGKPKVFHNLSSDESGIY